MLVNLNTPYGTGFSVSKDNMTFYNKLNDDFIFHKGEKIEIYVAPTKKTMKLNWKLKRNMVEAPLKTGYAECLQGYVFKIAVDEKDLVPGYFEFECEAEFGTGACALNPCSVKAYCTFGYDVDNIENFVKKPDDFDEFWKESLKKIEGVDLEIELGEEKTYTCEQIDDYNLVKNSLPMRYDEESELCDEVVVRKISFKSANGMRIYGWFARPKKEGKYPAIMIYPGGGYHSRSMPLEHARHGYCALDINVHGQDVDMPKEMYVPTPPVLEHDDVSDYKNYYFNDIYVHAIQALNALCAMDGVDKERIAVCGGSQGGRASVVAASLDKRVKAAVISIPHYGGEAYREWANVMNKNGDNGKVFDINVVDSAYLKGEAYYDLANFAPEIKCPVFCGHGLVDKVSPATSVKVLFDAIGSSNKTLIPFPMMAHDWNAQFDRTAWKWLKEVL